MRRNRIRSSLISVAVLAALIAPTIAFNAATIVASGAATQPALASVTSQTIAAANVAKVIPPATAPLTAWQNWSAGQRAAIESVPWAQLVADSGCTFQRATYDSVPAALGLRGAPQGVMTTSVTLTVHCSNGQVPSLLQQRSGKTPTAATASGVPSGDPCATIGGPGSECVEPFTVNGTPSYIDFSYLFQGTYTTGHEQLSNEGALASTCHPVTPALTDGITRGFHNGTEQLSYFGPRNYSSVWNGNFWHSYPGGFGNYGNVCAAL